MGEGLMMVTRGARDLLCVAAITVKSLGHTTMRKMTAVRNLPALAAQRVVTMQLLPASSPSPTTGLCVTSAYGTMPTTSITRRGAPQMWMLLVGTCQANGATVGLGALLMTILRQRQCPGLRYSGASGACSAHALSSAMVGRQQGTGSARESVAT